MVLSGLDVLLRQRPDIVRGRKVGLLCHAASVDRTLVHAAEALAHAGTRLTTLFGPEHGIDGAAQDMVGVASAVHPHFGVPVHSLYGAFSESLSPQPQWLEQIDVLLIDLQDIGCRYYTYIWTMLQAMRVCAELGVAVVVLDRPNPLGGVAVEGPGIDAGFESFVGLCSLPTRHGLTCGELASLLRAELRLDLELEVIPLQGWRREMFFEETRLPWVMPSPNMPMVDTAVVYPGACLLEGTNVSEGRGTTRPFEISGAPWVDGYRLAEALRHDLPEGVTARPLGFEPTFHKHRSAWCGGVQLHVTNRFSFAPLRTGVALLGALRRLWPERFAWRDEPYEFVGDRLAIDLLAGGPWLREGLAAGATVADLASCWRAQEADFAERRRPHLLYP